MTILCLGPMWRGSNAGGLFRALSRSGFPVDIVDEFYYISLRGGGSKSKVIQKLIRPLQISVYNKAVKEAILLNRPDVLFVYKGAFVMPDTLSYARQHNCRLALFYPDVSMTAHGKYLPKTIPMYDIVFTTKTFGIKDMENTFGVKDSFFVPHGFDPDIHRKLDISAQDIGAYGCDISFIGTWSPKKEAYLAHLKDKMQAIDLKIWGNGWNKASAGSIKSSIQGKPVSGDFYAKAIQCSKINLGILSEVVTGASSGDLITSRTFHIPGASGFLLHERNGESILYYQEGIEAAFFGGKDEMVQKVHYYLANEREREQVRMAGYERAVRDHSLDNRADTIVKYLCQL